MATLNILEYLDFYRVKSIQSDVEILSDSESIIIREIREKNFGVDFVYFNTDEKSNTSFPAVFLKKVETFKDVETLKAISETQRKIWNYKKVLFFYVYSETEIRIFNCSDKPLIITKHDFDYEQELKRIEIKSYTYSDKQQLIELNTLFSRVAIDTGIVWTLREAQFIRDKINLQKRVDKFLVESLINSATQLEENGLEINFIHKIILRSLFLLYLEDRGATDKQLYSIYKKDATSFFDILDDTTATYKLFERLEEDFNGNVFTLERNSKNEITEKISAEQLQIIKKCFISGNDNTPQAKLFDDWRLFNFSIIQIELLSEIYENFLFKTDPELKKKTGTYYTPPSLVEFILNEKLPANNGQKNFNVKILDPSCGSGIFLVESFKRLVKRYENKHQEKLNDFEKLKKLLTDNIFGIELNPQAIKVAAFSLYLALVDCLDPKTLWQKKKHRLPNLINNPLDDSVKEQGENLFCRDTIAHNQKIESIDFNLVVGNPPFGGLISDEKDIDNEHINIRNYCNKYKFAKEMVLPFLHKAVQFAPAGEIALIFNTKVLTNTGGTYKNFRKWLFQDCYVDKIFNFSILRNAKKDFGGQLFGDATGPISIAFYQKEKPKEPSEKIAYYAPKTFIKSNVIEGLSIDFTDLKFLPREECEKPESQIWKIAMWGGMNDWELLNSITEKFNKTITVFLKENKDNYDFGSGLHSPSPNQLKKDLVFSPKKVIDINKVERYYTLEAAQKQSEKIYRNINKDIFNPPYILIKEGQKDKEFCSSYIDYKSYNTAAYIISSKIENDFNLMLWCSLINSTFAKYYLSLTSASWGIERERVQSNETLTLPMITDIAEEVKDDLTNLFKNIINIKKLFEPEAVIRQILERDINKIIIKDILKLSEREETVIKDFIDFSFELFDGKEKSAALHPVSALPVDLYSTVLSKEINDFFYGQELFANVTTYQTSNFSPLMLIKLTFDSIQKPVVRSKEFLDQELKTLDQYLWEKKATNIYFRKKLNYKTGNDIFIIRPNQRRYWSQTMAVEDAQELILEILNES